MALQLSEDRISLTQRGYDINAGLPANISKVLQNDKSPLLLVRRVAPKFGHPEVSPSRPVSYNTDSSDDYQNVHNSSVLVLLLSIFYQKHHIGSNEKKMIRSLLIATLCLSSTIVVSVSAATNVPYTLTKRTSKAQIRDVPLEEGEDLIERGVPCWLTCPSGTCWYVPSPSLFLSPIIIHFPQPTHDQLLIPCPCSSEGTCCALPGVTCWYVALNFIIFITHHYSFFPTYNANNPLLMPVPCSSGDGCCDYTTVGCWYVALIFILLITPSLSLSSSLP
jgi:hypothetical protein